MDKDFNKIFANTIKYEGGYDDSMAQQGVVSNFGITQSLYDAHNKKHKKPVKSVKEISSYGEARDVAYEEIYEVAKADKIKDPKLKTLLFDYAYNSGPSQAVKTLQGLVGAKEDGIIGPKTMKKLNKYMKDNEGVLADQYLSERERFLQNLAIENPQAHQKHIQGWMNRINDLRNLQ